MRKRITTVLIAFLAIVMCATVQAQNPTSGTAGTLTWKYDTGTKTLTISGKGGDYGKGTMGCVQRDDNQLSY